MTSGNYWWWGSFLGLGSETRLDVSDHKRSIHPSDFLHHYSCVEHSSVPFGRVDSYCVEHYGFRYRSCRKLCYREIVSAATEWK